MNNENQIKYGNEEKNIEEEKSEISDEEFELFQKALSKEIVLELYSLFKLFEKNGLINYKIYIESITQIFKKYNKDKNHNFKDIFDLIFYRFQKIKCIMKNDKKVFYLINMVPQNCIETYIIVCFLTIFIKCRIIDKIKLLFELTDIDDDGFLNKSEIKQMISTINFMFCEENALINTNSSILAQSLMNIKVKEKLNKIMYDPGNLNIVLQKEKYINFDQFHNSLIKIKNYKYEIIPCFMNIKKCLYYKRIEKIIEIKSKNKHEFLRATSALSSDRPNTSNPFKRFKRNFSASNLGKIIKNVKINNDNNKIKIKKKSHLLLGIKEKNKSFRELLKESTIFSDDENENIQKKEEKSMDDRNLSSITKRIPYYNKKKDKKDKPSYIFEADFDKIKKIEVQPAILKFSNKKEEIIPEKVNISKKPINRYNSTLSSNSKELKQHMSTKDLNNKKFLNPKSNDLTKNIISFNKRGSLYPMRNTLLNNYNLHKDHHNSNFANNNNDNSNLINNSLKIHKSTNNYINNINNINKIIKKNKYNNIGIIKTNKLNKNIIKKPISSVNIFKKKILSNIQSNSQNRSKKNNNIIDNKNIRKINLNTLKYRRRNFNTIFSRNKNRKKLDTNKRINKYLSANEIIKDLDKNEEKLKHERTEYFGKELITLYKKMLKEKKEIRDMVGKYDKYDISLNFFDFKKKGFPKDYGKSIFSFNKYY